VLIISLSFFHSVSLSQEPDFSVTATNLEDVPIPLGWLPFTPEPNSPAHIPVAVGQVISQDLTFGGRAQMLLMTNTDSLTRHNILKRGAAAYITGTYKRKRVSSEGKIEYAIRCFLRDSETKALIYGKEYTSSSNQLRKVAHKFADEVVYQLFGELGIAQTRIVFTKKMQNGQKGKEIYIMDYDGENRIQVTQNRSLNLLPTWLHRNKEILYTSYKQGSPQLVRHNLQTGSSHTFIYSPYLNIGAEYNSVDEEIVYTSSVRGNTEIFRKLVHKSSGNTSKKYKPRRLTFSYSLESSPSWSPNGYEIVFTSGRSGEPHLYIMDRDGSNIRRLTYDGNYNVSPAWSPNGDKIAFVRMEGTEMNIWTISPNGEDPVQLTSGMGQNENPSWSPDGRALIFSSNRDGSEQIYSMWADGRYPKKLTHQGINATPQWSHY
jgi:TolB protein